MPDVLQIRAGAAGRGARGRRMARPAAAGEAGGPGATARAETLVFRIAMAAAALWVLDDAFWHREPGTAIGDHLAMQRSSDH